MNSPFKLLDPYGPEDIKAFFGRERETQELYNLVSKNRLTFVYGPSGSGKTSLVRCGLSNRFKGIDWLPLFVRRGDDINQSLRDAFGKALGQKGAYEGELGDAIEALFSRYLRPVYLIFDQFEELFILGDPDDSLEREPFYNTIADLLDLELPCRVLFIIREDYFGYLDKFERLIPELYHRKLRVEPMTRERLREVIVGSCAVYDIPFGDAQADPERILDNLFEERSSVEMPFVQVYLHKLYGEAAELYGDAEGALRFDQQVIDQLGPIQNALAQFLEDQERDILEALAPLQPPQDIVRKVLNVFVSNDGTKIPLSYITDTKGQTRLTGKAAELVSALDPALLSACLHELENNRILSRREDKLEVAHDTLAALIDQQRSGEQRHLNDLRRRIELGYKEHLESKGTYFFNRNQLARIEPYREQLALKEEWASFLEASRQDCEARENAEKRRAQKELALAEEKLAAEKAAQEARDKQLELAKANLQAEQQARTRQRRLTAIAVIVALLAIVASMFAISSNRIAQEQKAEARRMQGEAEAQREKAQNVLDKIYFYEGSFGLAYDEKEKKYGFIDKELNTKIEFKYDEALPFDYTGFARVKKYDFLSGINKNYLIDTTGREYPVAYDVNQINKQTVAVDLRNRQLDSLPEAIYEHRPLQILLASGNDLQHLSEEIGQLSNLIILNLRKNNFSELPTQIAQLRNLNEFYLGGNKLSKLPNQIAQLQNLTMLDLGGNQLRKLPTQIAQLHSLASLDLSYNQFSELPTQIAQLHSLTSLDLGGNGLSKLPTQIAQLHKLTSLDLGGNQLSELPTQIAQLHSLASLDLSYNQFSELPTQIAQLHKLTSLDLGGNGLSELPMQIAQLHSLASLDLSYNQFSELPTQIAQLHSLTALGLGGNQLSKLPTLIAQLHKLTLLDLQGNQLSKLPTQIAQLPKLASLDLGYNQFSELPPEIGQLQNLTALDLGDNQLSELPPEIGQLHKLNELSLYSNQFSELPPQIRQLQNLTTLDLGSNQLSKLSPQIAQLQKLTLLSLSGNQFSELTPKIGQLYNLTSLSLSGNQLSELPTQIAQLQNLTELDLRENNFTEAYVQQLQEEMPWCIIEY